MTATVRGIKMEDGDREGSINRDAERDYTIVYQVGTDDKKDGPSVVMSAFGIPNIGDMYTPGNDLDASAVVVNKSARQGQSPWDWLVDVTYTTDFEREPKALTDPLQQDPEISFGFQERRILIPGRFNDPSVPDPNGLWQNGIFAPNGELFDPQPEANYADPVWTIKKNVQSIDYITFMKLANCVNMDVFQGAPARTLQLKPPLATRKWHKTVQHYWEISYSIVYRFETWDIQILNMGTYYFPSGVPAAWWSSTELRQTKKDDNGCPLVINLTTAGNINTTSTPTFTRIRFYREVAFATLNLL